METPFSPENQKDTPLFFLGLLQMCPEPCTSLPSVSSSAFRPSPPFLSDRLATCGPAVPWWFCSVAVATATRKQLHYNLIPLTPQVLPKRQQAPQTGGSQNTASQRMISRPASQASGTSRRSRMLDLAEHSVSHLH